MSDFFHGPSFGKAESRDVSARSLVLCTTRMACPSSVALAVSCLLTHVQLERKAQARIDEKWKALERKAKKEAKKLGDAFVPPQQRPEASFIAALVDQFVRVWQLFCEHRVRQTVP